VTDIATDRATDRGTERATDHATERSPLAHRVDANLVPDPSRVVFRLFLPGEETRRSTSRVGAVVARVLALPDEEIEEYAVYLQREFWPDETSVAAVVAQNARVVAAHVDHAAAISPSRRLVLGAALTAGYTLEGAALCNPSAVPHPDQSGLERGELRVALSVRGIGEGHISSIEFVTAVVGPDATWRFDPRAAPPVVGTVVDAPWRREHLRAKLTDAGRIDDLAFNVLALLPEEFTSVHLEDTLQRVHGHLLAQPDAPETVATLRSLVASVYDVEFPEGIRLSQQVLLPYAAEESHGMEDARFVLFTGDDGATDYRATYTAYDGRSIAPRLLTSPDLHHFTTGRLSGPASVNKGMALFPRRIAGRFWAMCRTDGESNGVTSSADGVVWDEPAIVQRPVEAWELVQIGNCGSPIETEHGWLVLTHGVGPMRAYAISAILLDLEDPTRMVARLRRPLLETTVDERHGYVPHVLYSCGGLVHDGLLWIPYGASDQRIRVAWVELDALVDQMLSEVGAGTA
jgi:predicted GH43/DUF377 family glycosyl hydrolase